MRHYPAKAGQRSPTEHKHGPIVPTDDAAFDTPIATSPPESPFRSFLSFRYSSVEVSLQDDVPRVRARRARFENGTLRTEAFEGELTRGAYARMLGDVERLVAGQTQLVLRALSMFLPSKAKRPGRE